MCSSDFTMSAMPPPRWGSVAARSIAAWPAMASEGRSLATLASGLALAAGGALLVLAWQAGLWASAAGALLVVLWIVGASGWAAMHHPPPRIDTPADALDPLSVRLLLDQIPVPLVRVDADGARAINRAARTLFATDERILPLPPEIGRAHV